MTLTHHNILNNGYFVGRAMRADRDGPALHPGAALSLLRHGDGQSRGCDPRRDHGLSGRGLRSAGDAGDGASRSGAPRSTACRPCSSPSSSIRSSRASTCQPLRTGIMAGSPCPIEVMRRVDRADAHARGHHRLRHDRDQPGQLPERASTIRWSGASRPSAASIRISR